MTDNRFDGLLPNENLMEWHIPVRCHSSFEGQLPLPEGLVPDGDAVLAIKEALLKSDCHVVALVGDAGTGKTTALGWLLHVLKQEGIVSTKAFRCASRTSEELQHLLAQDSELDQCQLLIIDGLDELLGKPIGSLDDLLKPLSPRLFDGSIRVVLSVRPEEGRMILNFPTREWGEAWAGVQTVGGARVAVFRLQELRRRDVERYALKRGLGADFVAHLRSLYDLRELVRRFFLLVKLCDLSEKIAPDEWKQIRARNKLYERLLTTWLTSEHQRDPNKLSLQAGDQLVLLEQVAFQIDRWTGHHDGPLVTRLGVVLQDIGTFGADSHVLAAALVNANIVCETGFAHKSMEEYLLARALSRLVRKKQTNPLNPARVTDDVISFLIEDENFQAWLNGNQDKLADVSADYLPHLVRLLPRQGRMIPKLNLQEAKLDNLQLLGISLRGADLRKADLTGTQLGPADLTEADLRGTVLHRASVWTAGWASELYSSADAPDRVWLIHPKENVHYGLAVLVQIGESSGRITACHEYETRSSKVRSDGQSLYRLLPTTRMQGTEVTQWLGEEIPVECWWLSSMSVPLASKSLPGAVWQVGTNCATLYDDDEKERQVYPHRNGAVRDTLGVSKTSLFAQHKIDGFYLVGSRLYVVGPNLHKLISDGFASGRQLSQIAVVGETRIVFQIDTVWHSWTPAEDQFTTHRELNDVIRIVMLPEGGFSLIRPETVEFVDENFHVRRSQMATIDNDAHLAGIKREGTPAVVVKDYQGLYLIDENLGRDPLDWLKLQAKGARFDQQTVLSNDFRAALTSAGARDESLISTAPLLLSLENIMATPTMPPHTAQSLFDVLLITVNQHEFDAVYQIACERLGKDPVQIHKPKRSYFDLGSVAGLRVGMVRSQMGSTQPGATTTTTLQAMYEVCPRYLIAVGVAFGIDPEKQQIGQILYSEKLQDYNLIKAATAEQTKDLKIIPRGDKVSPNPTFLNRVQSAADIWRFKEKDTPISPVLLLSGDTLVDNFDYREQLLELFPEARGGEMEATGIYAASREDETPWMIIKAICDYADGHKRENKEARQKLAANNAARFVFFLMEQGGLKEN